MTFDSFLVFKGVGRFLIPATYTPRASISLNCDFMGGTHCDGLERDGRGLLTVADGPVTFDVGAKLFPAMVLLCIRPLMVAISIDIFV